MKPGDKVWFMDSNNKREATVVRISGTRAIIKFCDRNGGIRISLNRLFVTEKDIDNYISKDVKNDKISYNNSIKSKNSSRRNQYDYMK